MLKTIKITNKDLENLARIFDLNNPGEPFEETVELKSSSSSAGSLNPFFGQKHTEESKMVMRAKRANQVFTQETQLKRRDAMLGSRNHRSKAYVIENKKTNQKYNIDLQRPGLLPRAGSVARKDDVVDKLHEQTRYMWVSMMILTVMGATIALGVVYNQARIALSTRSRHLASLRVLGFTRAEISAVLLGELASYLIVGVPLGWLLGRGLVFLISSTADPESYRMPTYVSPATYAFAAVAIIGAAAISALVVRRRLDHLDLVSVLKARE